LTSKVKVCFIIPGNDFSMEFVKSWTSLVDSFKDFGVEASYVFGYCANIYQVRSHTVRDALQTDADYFMFIDSDTIFSTLDFYKLLNHNKDIVSGMVLPIGDSPTAYHKRDVTTCVSLEDKHISYSEAYDMDELIEVKHNGMAFMLVNREVFEVTKNPFTPIVNSRNGDDEILGEDYSFQVKAFQNGYRSYVDTTLRLGHMKNLIISEIGEY
tara:strand:- start:60 stop:695 length:636 start_codon:yes stop_codon:yes gene_type:complete